MGKRSQLNPMNASAKFHKSIPVDNRRSSPRASDADTAREYFDVLASTASAAPLLGPHPVALAAQPHQHAFHVPRVPQYDHVHNQAERIQQVFLSCATCVDTKEGIGIERATCN